jgi:hypothetical protein
MDFAVGQYKLLQPACEPRRLPLRLKRGDGRGEVSKSGDEPARYSKLSWAKLAVRKHHRPPGKLARMNLAIRGIDPDLSANSNDENFDNLRRLLLQ